MLPYGVHQERITWCLLYPSAKWHSNVKSVYASFSYNGPPWLFPFRNGGHIFLVQMVQIWCGPYWEYAWNRKKQKIYYISMNWVQKRENMKISCHTGLGSHLPAFNRCFGAHIVARPEMPALRTEHPCKPQTSIPMLSSKNRSHFRFCAYLLPPDCIHSFFIRQNSLG